MGWVLGAGEPQKAPIPQEGKPPPLRANSVKSAEAAYQRVTQSLTSQAQWQVTRTQVWRPCNEADASAGPHELLRWPERAATVRVG